ncbi:MAG: arylsulfatase [Planctomycetes bacterium]|nr:arylsulfatase [Planctomycetota bacterium]
MLTSLLISLLLGGKLAAGDPPARPNIVFVLADDLGWAELGSYGQTKIRTPCLDELAEGGMRFTQHYAGAPVCAPSRCVLMTGMHPGHAYVRDNTEGGGWGPDSVEGQRPLLPDTATIGTVLQGAGYATACIGKWGLGGPDSTGAPERQGFDHFFGYLCQRRAHNFYPTHLWKDGEKISLKGNEWGNLVGDHYAHDLMTEDALEWVRINHDQPFFLYLPYTIPHLALQVPDDSLAEYSGLWEDPPYKGGKGYLPHPEPRAAYAAMVTRMDRDIGRVVDLLNELGVRENTIVMFASDNGATFDIGGADSPFFDSCGPFRGRKGSVWEGGIRVPLIANWPGKIEAGKVSDHLSAFWDLMETCAELAGIEAPRNDGISFLPTLLGKGKQQQHRYLYWEFPGYRGQQAMRWGRWKAVRRNLVSGEIRTQLFDIREDPGESRDLSLSQSEVLAQMEVWMEEAHTPSAEYPLQSIDAEFSISSSFTNRDR